MPLRVGKPSTQNIAAGLKKYGSDVGSDLKGLTRTLVKGKGWSAIGKELRNTGATLGAEFVGVVELSGLRYPVSKYEFTVSEGLTRGSRIDDPRGHEKLAKQGFKGIVDLTLEGTNDAQAGKAAGLNTLNVKILDNSAPTQKQVKQFLDFATNARNSPCYVHCQAGKGRTGVAVAAYRMAVEGWPADRAIAEAREFGCSLPDQLEFLQNFGADLAKGRIDGYPKVS